MASHAISMQLKAIRRNPSPFLISAGPVGDDDHHWEAILRGPENTPYEGGVFKLAIIFHPEYPIKPSMIRFKTKVFHPNVDDYGHIFHKLLTIDHYNPFYTIPRLLTCIYEMMDEPLISEDDHVEKEIARLYTEDRVVFKSRALSWTLEHAAE